MTELVSSVTPGCWTFPTEVVRLGDTAGPLVGCMPVGVSILVGHKGTLFRVFKASLCHFRRKVRRAICKSGDYGTRTGSCDHVRSNRRSHSGRLSRYFAKPGSMRCAFGPPQPHSSLLRKRVAAMPTLEGGGRPNQRWSGPRSQRSETAVGLRTPRSRTQGGSAGATPPIMQLPTAEWVGRPSTTGVSAAHVRVARLPLRCRWALRAPPKRARGRENPRPTRASADAATDADRRVTSQRLSRTAGPHPGASVRPPPPPVVLHPSSAASIRRHQQSPHFPYPL